jgi:hypothetical protein
MAHTTRRLPPNVAACHVRDEPPVEVELVGDRSQAIENGSPLQRWLLGVVAT